MTSSYNRPPILVLAGRDTGRLATLYTTLTTCGHKVLRAHNGADTLRLAREARADLILLDTGLPGMDDLSLSRQLLETTTSRTILLATGQDTGPVARGLALGAVDYIGENASAEEIGLRVKTQLARARDAVETDPHHQGTPPCRQMLETLNEGVYGLDPDGLITFANPVACQLTGYTQDELLGLSVHEAHLYARRDGRPYYPVENGIYVSLRDGQPGTSENDVFWRHQGDCFPASWSCAPIRAADGSILGAVLIFRDISQRKHQDQAISKALADATRLRDRLQSENRYLQNEIVALGCFDSVIGDSPAIRGVIEQLQQVAPTNSTVLICGEPGTGKETIARQIHAWSQRHDRPLIRVDCRTINPDRIEIALFGREKGTPPHRSPHHQGYVELANGGTLLLQSIDELSLDVQAKLLRLLQSQEYSPAGSGFTLRTDVRLIATTSRDISELVENGRFIAELFHRLNVFPLRIPPLRQRREDIPLLAEKFLAEQSRHLQRPKQRLTSQCIRELQTHHWPGNIRELQNLIERAAILLQEQEICITPDQISPARKSAQRTPPAAGRPPGLRTLAENEAAHILRVLEQTQGLIAGKGGAAEILGLPPSTLRSRMKKLGLGRST